MTTERAPEFADAEPLPGLEPAPQGSSVLRQAAHRSIVALEAADYLDETHAVITALILDLSGRIARAKDYAAANLSAQLLAAYAVITPESEGGGTDAFAELVADIRRSTAQARDPLDARTQE